MTHDEIIRMAREAGSIDSEDVIETIYAAFAAAAVASEREACASIVQANAEACDTYSTARRILESNAAAIRERSANASARSNNEG